MEAPDPWLIELIVVAGGHTNVERMTLSRDVGRGLLIRLRRGVCVEHAGFTAMTPEQQHIVRLRAFAAVAGRPVVFSHVSAAVLLGLPVLRTRLSKVHVVVGTRNERGQDGVVGHLLPLDETEIVRVGGLLVTAPARTVADIATAMPFEDGVIAADAALRAGLPRDLLQAAAELIGPRPGSRRFADVIAFAHPGAESAAESRSRVSFYRLGLEPPQLQHRLVLADGWEIFLDVLFPTFLVGGEVDGAMKLLDPAISRDAREALLREKRREDAARLQLRGLARWGWIESGSTARLGTVLRAVGVVPAPSRPTLADYAAVARAARPRRSVQR